MKYKQPLTHTIRSQSIFFNQSKLFCTTIATTVEDTPLPGFFDPDFTPPGHDLEPLVFDLPINYRPPPPLPSPPPPPPPQPQQPWCEPPQQPSPPPPPQQPWCEPPQQPSPPPPPPPPPPRAQPQQPWRAPPPPPPWRAPPPQPRPQRARRPPREPRPRQPLPPPLASPPQPPLLTTSMDDFAFLKSSNLQPQPINRDNYSQEALLLSKAYTSQVYHDFNQRVKIQHQFNNKITESLVLEVLKLITEPQMCIWFFKWAKNRPGYLHTPRAYDALMESLQLHNAITFPENYIAEITNDDRVVMGKLFNVLVEQCCKRGLWNAAFEELNRLKGLGYKPSVGTYNALLAVLLKAEQLETAVLVRGEMRGLGFRVDDYALGYFAYSLSKLGGWREALGMVEEEEFTPDIEFYSKVISGLCEASLFEEVFKLFEVMRSSGGACVPNDHSYRTLLSGCLRKGQLDLCKRVVGMMAAAGCYPGLSVFNSLIHGFGKAGDYDYCHELLKMMGSSGSHPGYVVYNAFIGGICTKEDLPSIDLLEMAEQAYTEMLDSGFVLNKVNVVCFVACLCKAQRFDRAFSVIREMMTKGFSPDTTTYNKVISLLCKASSLEKGFKLFQQMRENSVPPDKCTYNVLISTFCTSGFVRQASDLFAEMIREGCAPDIMTFSSLIHAYLKAKKVSEANELFEKMVSAGCTPDIFTYNILVDGHVKAGNLRKASQIYSRMKGDATIPDIDMYFRGDGNTQLEPDVFTYGALIHGLCKANRVGEACDLLNTMATEGCEADQVVYNHLISGFCKIRKIDEAQEVIRAMSQRGYNPDVYTFNIMMNRLVNDNQLDAALSVLSDMLQNFCPPSVVTYNILIGGFCKVGRTDEANKLLVMMEEKGCLPNVQTYTAMMDGFGKMANVEMSLKLLEVMVAKGCAPNLSTYRVLIKHCCAAGRLEEAHKLLEEMKHTYLPTNVAGYDKLILGFNEKFTTSVDILDGVSENVSVPIASAYMFLIDSFDKAGRLEMALELHKDILTSLGHSVLSPKMYCNFIKSLSHAFKVEKALDLYGEMTRQGFIPEIDVCFHLIRGLLKNSKWSEALQLSHAICHMDVCWHSRKETFDIV